MPDIKIPIILGDKTVSDSDYQDAVPINMIAVLRDVNGDSGYLYSHDGLTLAATGQGYDRGALYNERMRRSFRVSGQKLIEIKSVSGVITAPVIGDISGADLVSFDYSFNSIMIVADQRAYRFDGANLVLMTDPDIGAPIDVAQIDGYYVFTDGEYLYHTDIGDETSIDPLKFATSELSPDPTKAVGRTQDDLLIVFNRYTTEYFINQANEQFAFSRLNQKAVDAGIVGTHAWCPMDGNIFILGGRKDEDVSVYVLGSGQTVSISTRFVDSIVGQYTEDQLSTAKLESRTSKRDQLLYIHLPNETLVYNQSIAKKFGVNSAWSIMQFNDGPWRAINFAFDPNLNMWLAGDRFDEKIARLDPSTASQYGEAIDSYFYTPFVPVESASIDSLELNTVSGFNSEDVSLFLSTTRDGSNYSSEWSKEVSVVTDYEHRYIARRLGYVRKKIGFKFRAHHKDKINVSGLVASVG